MVGLFTGLWWGLTKIMYIAVTMLIISQLLEPDFPSPAILFSKILKIRCVKDTRCTGEIHPWAESQKMSDFVIKLEYSKEMGIEDGVFSASAFFPQQNVYVCMDCRVGALITQHCNRLLNCSITRCAPFEEGACKYLTRT